MNENTSMTQVRGSLGGSSVPAFPAETKVYHERNGEIVKTDPIWAPINELISSGRLQPSQSIEHYEYGRFVVEDFRIRVVRKTWQPGPGYSWAETIVYVMGDE